MKKLVRFLSSILLSAGLVFTVSATGQQDETKKSTDKASSITSIKFMIDGTWLQPDNGEQIPAQAWEQMTGLKLIMNHPPHNEYAQKLDLAFTTGDIPDVFVMSADSYVKYAAAGALYDMTDLYENSKLKKNISNQSLVDALRLNGKLYAIPHQRGNGTLTYVRGDWLEKLGMSAPRNYVEFIDMLRAFKNNNPDGLAPEDVIPITGAGLAGPEYPMDIYLREFYQDATPDYVLENGTWVDGMLQPNMVGALTRMRDAYAEGLIDTEIITNKTSTCRSKFFSGTVGVFNYWAGAWNQRLQDGITPNVPGAKVVGIPAIKETKYIERAPGIVAMSAKVKNPQAVFDNWFELINDNGPGQMIFTFGVEGKTYKVVDGVIEFLPSILNPDQPFHKTWVDPTLVVTTFAPKFKVPELVTTSLKTFQESAQQYGLPCPSEKLGQLQSEINEIKRNIIAEIVFGNMTVDQGLTKYKQDIKKYNDIVLPDMNK